MGSDAYAHPWPLCLTEFLPCHFSSDVQRVRQATPHRACGTESQRVLLLSCCHCATVHCHLQPHVSACVSENSWHHLSIIISSSGNGSGIGIGSGSGSGV